MKKYFLLFAAVLGAAYVQGQCNYKYNKTDKVTGDIIRIVNEELIETVAGGKYTIGLSVIKEKKTTEKIVDVTYNFNRDITIAGQRCIAPGQTKLILVLENGKKIEIPSIRTREECSTFSLIIRFDLSAENVATLKASPVTDLTLYYTGNFYENVKLGPVNSVYFMNYLRCLE